MYVCIYVCVYIYVCMCFLCAVVSSSNALFAEFEDQLAGCMISPSMLQIIEPIAEGLPYS